MLGDSRRRKLKAMQEKDRLEPIEAPESLAELKQAVREIAVDGYRSPREDILKRMDRVHGKLPDDAQPAYVRDRTLLRRINAARRQFETWKGRAIRYNEMPGAMECGPANYPIKKFRKRQSSEHRASEELTEKLDRVYSAVSGGRQRALQSIGSSVAEQNEKRREARREDRRNSYEPGDVVVFRNPDLQVGRVVRVNKKSVRVEYPNRFYGGSNDYVNTADKWVKDTIQLDSKHLVRSDAETVAAELEQRGSVRGYGPDHPALEAEAQEVTA